MRKKIHKVGSFYGKITMKYMGVFLFVGLFSVFFGEHGWWPMAFASDVAGMVYYVMLPCLIAYGCGKKIGQELGAILALIAAAGAVAGNDRTGMLGAMILGPLCGLYAKKVLYPLTECTKASIQMLVKNLLLALSGVLFALLAYLLSGTLLKMLSDGTALGIDYLISEKWIALSSILIEPAKVFFLNNGINHGILIPLGMQQVESTGKSILFLLETNPGPGMGIMFAMLLRSRDQRQQYGAGLFTHAIGGIHEVYFPVVIGNMWLLIPAILGGMAGTFCFAATGAGLGGAVSPGSIVTLLLMAGKGDTLQVLLGILISAVVSFVGAMFILQWNIKKIEHTEDKMEEFKQISHICFVCDGGVGSSVMGAALFRRRLAAEGITQIPVTAGAIDQMEFKRVDDVLIVCQESFAKMNVEALKEWRVFQLETLVGGNQYGELLEYVKRCIHGIIPKK